MSETEYQRLVRGKTLRNTRNHASNGQKTTSVGFCFFTEPPEEAIHWLSTIVDTDWCVTLDIPDEMLTESKGLYRDPEEDNKRAWFEEPAAKWRTEWCLKKYSTRTARIIEASDKYKYYLADLLNSIFPNLKP